MCIWPLIALMLMRVAAELVSRGVELELAPTNFDAAGVRLLFIRDNNGNLIEIVTPLSAYQE